MKRALWLIIPLGLFLMSLGLAGCNVTSPPARTTAAAGIINTQNTGIWVNGEGKVTVVPDVAILTLGVEARAATVQQAQSQASSSMNAIVNELKAGGVADKDIQTRVFNIQRLTRFDPQKQEEVPLGFQVTNTVAAKIRNVANTGIVIDAVARAGGDNARINSVSFSVDDPSKFLAEARQKAMADAKSKAEQLAKLAGVKLGDPTYINESGGFIPFQQPRVFLGGAPSARSSRRAAAHQPRRDRGNPERANYV